MTQLSQTRAQLTSDSEIMATSPRGRFYPASAIAVADIGANGDEVSSHGNSTLASYVTIRGDCYDVLDMYRRCVRNGEIETPLCSATVSRYLRCSESDK
mmetsp:Transcript_31432/g.57974  ORF Transcript_31432/g.57974 Transcript_31432/m.57974 type:complete len:99 (-) Transcript_31432:513-809(-)|eukprot:CAMPEP_0197455840 /NCGR_PEP_ID=MMETSP1175-20131217/41782_1 /TAXON_ID=1003142 /ORGANISM="Triceratium dubium, Strain CCMP147" /LENGTH=98 /DNA_ID=CAMNT_0042989801 /DNA_START=351 /DNA_END=647 /DNA_ORIENTATION=-